jgi:hypothetical protein
VRPDKKRPFDSINRRKIGVELWLLLLLLMMITVAWLKTWD